WIKFLKKHHFYVGLSIDGPRELHDIYRKTHSGKSTFNNVYNTAKRLRQAKIPFAALCVVNRSNALHPKEVYRFLVDQIGAQRVQFTPAVEPQVFKEMAPALIDPTNIPRQNHSRAHPDHPLSIVTPWSVDPNHYGSFLCDVWDEWIATDIGRVHVNIFETAIAQSAGMPAQMCTQSETCGKAVAVEHNGDVFSCDHFVYKEYHVGNILHTHLGNIAFSPAQQNFGMNKRNSLPTQCKTCDYLRLCWGECPKNRLIRTEQGEVGLNYLCSGLYHFYEHIGPDVIRILKTLGHIE
ncbi:MAG: SPASM domain-containing protein, partial [Shewanella sp.]